MCHVPFVPTALDFMDNMVLNNTHRHRQTDTDTLSVTSETTMSICSAREKGVRAYLFAPSPGSMPLQFAQLHIRSPLFA